jgi:NAD(P)-dependent dehydrogenase (short-subunit alcohol dehydrogenase family)
MTRNAIRRSAIITGASSGIGLAVAQQLVELGYAVTLAARRAAPLQRIASKLGDAATACPTDVGREEALQDLVREHHCRHGAVDVLVNAAGVSAAGGLAEASTEMIDTALGVNLRAVHLLTRECVPLLRSAAAKRGSAYVVNIASIVGIAAAAPVAAYSAAKAGVISLTQATHAELANEGIRATVICPSYVNTPMAKTSPLKPAEMIQPEDVARAITFLLSLSGACVVPQIVLQLPGDRFSSW